MKINLPNLKPYEIVVEILNTMLRIDRVMTMEAFVINVVEHYRETVLPEKREIAFHVGRDPKRDIESNTQIIRRALDGIYNIDSEKVRILSILRLIELQESFISIMMEPYKAQCLQTLMKPYGMVPMTITELGNLGEMELFTQLTSKTGKVLTGLSVMMENGVLGPEDIQHKPELLTDMTDLIKHVEETIAMVDKKVTDNVRDIKSQ